MGHEKCLWCPTCSKLVRIHRTDTSNGYNITVHKDTKYMIPQTPCSFACCRGSIIYWKRL